MNKKLSQEARTTPLFGCANCFEDYSYPKEDLRVHEGELWCDNCYDECVKFENEGAEDWYDLPHFEPIVTATDVPEPLRLKFRIEGMQEAEAMLRDQGYPRAADNIMVLARMRREAN